MEAAKKPTPQRCFSVRVRSLTKAGVTYQARYSNRQWTCSCPDARHRHRVCKHVAILRVLGVVRAKRFAAGQP